jgi:hypothetical protein
MRRYLNEEEFESICCRCGICCGSEDGDPCEHLRQDKEGKYYCPIYEKRFGIHRTINGTIIRCVPIEEALRSNPELRKQCAYAKAAQKLYQKPKAKKD